MKTAALTFALFALCVVILAHGIAATVWQWRNPKANRMTIWTHYADVIQFKKLDKFQ